METKHEIPEAFVEANKKVTDAQPSQADISDALPEECAVEVTGIRGKKRIDYNGVPLRNADGTMNKYAKNLIDLHEPVGRIGVEVTQKLQAGDYRDHPQHTVDFERKQHMSRGEMIRIAKSMKLEPIFTSGSRFMGRTVCDETGMPNLWFNQYNRLVRIALVGTAASSRAVEYPA